MRDLLCRARYDPGKARRVVRDHPITCTAAGRAHTSSAGRFLEFFSRAAITCNTAESNTAAQCRELPYPDRALVFVGNLRTASRHQILPLLRGKDRSNPRHVPALADGRDAGQPHVR